MPLCAQVLHQDGAHQQSCIAEALPGSVYCAAHQPQTPPPSRSRLTADVDLPWPDEDQVRIQAVRRSRNDS